MKGYRKTLHSVFDIKVHIVFVTKYRREVLTDDHLKDLELIINNICDTYNTVLIEFNGEADHIHMILSIPPRIAVSNIVNVLKSVTSRMLRKKYDIFKTVYWGSNVALWTRSYFVASVGEVSLDTLKKYIKNQNRPIHHPPVEEGEFRS